MSPTELSKSQFGKGIPANVCSYHFKELARFDLIKVAGDKPRNSQRIRYEVTHRLTQSLLDAAAIATISEVLAGIPEPLAQWIEQPYLDDIRAFVDASGRSVESDKASKPSNTQQ
jgi:hypothetical protein